MYKNNQFGQKTPLHSCFECARPPKFKDTNAINSVMSKFSLEIFFRDYNHTRDVAMFVSHGELK